MTSNDNMFAAKSGEQQNSKIGRYDWKSKSVVFNMKKKKDTEKHDKVYKSNFLL